MIDPALRSTAAALQRMGEIQPLQAVPDLSEVFNPTYKFCIVETEKFTTVQLVGTKFQKAVYCLIAAWKILWSKI